MAKNPPNFIPARRPGPRPGAKEAFEFLQASDKMAGLLPAARRVGQLQADCERLLPTLGADRVALTGEVGFSHVNGLPSADMIRFGRGTAYGAAAYVGANGALTACVDQVTGKTCTTDGYTTSNAWGVRMVASATYSGLPTGATLTPSLAVFKDVKGFSYDGTFSEGRTMVRPAVRAEWRQKYFADLQYNRFSGGRYNLLVDRSYWALTAGLRF